MLCLWCMRQEEVNYPLRERGARIVVGRTAGMGDSGGGVVAGGSNGAGKSALVMAPLWALSGETDARPEGNATSAAAARGLRGESISVGSPHFQLHLIPFAGYCPIAE
jgi:hypothetical protein